MSKKDHSKEVERWITVNGHHVPIYKGERVASAMSRYVASKNEEVKAKQIALNKAQADALNKTQKPKQQTRSVNLTNEQKSRMLNEFQRVADDYGQRVDNMKTASSFAKNLWKSKSEAAKRLVNYGGLPALTGGYAASVVFETLPNGSEIEVINAKNEQDNGTWIRGFAKSYNGNPVWTHVADAKGNSLSRARGTSKNRGTDEWIGRIANDEVTTQLRVKKYK